MLNSYESYCDWCVRRGLPFASFEVWQSVSDYKPKGTYSKPPKPDHVPNAFDKFSGFDMGVAEVIVDEIKRGQ